jgi:FMN phosphatase YigB (HAD superfamily)
MNTTLLPRHINVVAIDIANTIERVETTQIRQLDACKLMIPLITRSTESLDPEVLRDILRSRFRKLHSWRLVNLIEPTEEQMWTKWMLFDHPVELVSKVAKELTSIWMGVWYEREFLHNSFEAIQIIKSRGYKVICISNTLSTTFTIDSLKKYGVYDSFDLIILSSDLHLRKPHRDVFMKAASLVEEPPENICYVGDQLSRDVVGSINAGYGWSVLVGAAKSGSWHDDATIWPDLKIPSIADLPSYLSREK